MKVIVHQSIFNKIKFVCFVCLLGNDRNAVGFAR